MTDYVITKDFFKKVFKKISSKSWWYSDLKGKMVTYKRYKMKVNLKNQIFFLKVQR